VLEDEGGTCSGMFLNITTTIMRTSYRLVYGCRRFGGNYFFPSLEYIDLSEELNYLHIEGGYVHPKNEGSMFL
jgi:hypothetical protein